MADVWVDKNINDYRKDGTLKRIRPLLEKTSRDARGLFEERNERGSPNCDECDSGDRESDSDERTEIDRHGIEEPRSDPSEPCGGEEYEDARRINDRDRQTRIWGIGDRAEDENVRRPADQDAEEERRCHNPPGRDEGGEWRSSEECGPDPAAEEVPHDEDVRRELTVPAEESNREPARNENEHPDE